MMRSDMVSDQQFRNARKASLYGTVTVNAMYDTMVLNTLCLCVLPCRRFGIRSFENDLLALVKAVSLLSPHQAPMRLTMTSFVIVGTSNTGGKQW